MSIAVIIPFTSDDGHRNAAALIVKAFWHTEFPTVPNHRQEVQIILAPDTQQPFSRAQAINDAAASTTADILVINDADSLCEPEAVQRAVLQATLDPGLVRAYTHYKRLTKEATEALTPSTYLDAWQGPFDWEMENAHAHGCVAVRRECFEQVGGYDPKFRGWGYEDLAAEMLYDAHWPDRRIDGTLVHLWHSSVSDAPEVEANAELYYGRYEKHRGDAAALLALRNEP